MDNVELVLPNGFHDGVLHQLSVDYRIGTLTLDVLFWIGGFDDGQSEMYRLGRVTVSGLELFVIDKPTRFIGPQAELTIDGGLGQPSGAAVELPSLAAGCFLYWLFVNEWSSFIRFAGRDAVLVWMGAPIDKT